MSNPSNLKIFLVGATGRMGKEVIRAAARQTAAGLPVRIVGGLCAPGETSEGEIVDGIEAPLMSKFGELNGVDVIIDFSSAAGAIQALAAAEEYRVPLLLCSTGLDSAVLERLTGTAKKVPIIRSANTSVGVNVMVELVNSAARMLGETFESEIVEIHHHTKKDAPSGTALLLAKALTEAREKELKAVACYGREGNIGARRQEELGIHAVRGGDVAGEHTVYFFGSGERLELTHRATTPAIFADGALRAASWLDQHAKAGGAPGLYSMKDVLAA